MNYSECSITKKEHPMPTLPPLSMAERSRRWDLARDIMQAEGLRALVVYGDREAPRRLVFPRLLLQQRPPRIHRGLHRRRSAQGLYLRLADDRGPHPGRVARRPAMDRAGTAVRGQDRPRRRRLAGRAGLDGSRIGIIGLEPYPPFYFDGAVPARTLQGMTQACPRRNSCRCTRPSSAAPRSRARKSWAWSVTRPPSAKP